MVNKKSRTRFQELDFDLPPTKLAKTTNLSTTKARKQKKRRSQSAADGDDTPKAFARLMAGGPRRSGLDDGPVKKRKRLVEEEEEKGKEALKIQPGESLREFGRRVDTALPVKFPRGDGSSLKKEKKKGKKKVVEEIDPTIEPEEGEEVHSDDDEEAEERNEMLRQAQAGFDAAKRQKRGRKRGDSPDPWAELEKQRKTPRFGEVAHAPPVLKKPRALLYMAGSRAAVDVDGVPKSSGSLAKREELAGERRSIVDAYRKLMGDRRAAAGL